ncbi:MAG TPA: LLM class flavin-dependent oxidoreductase [Acidimicrobiales bacterium]|nr:LLM class flavin-dependent oxidoreductase [Acidimicrobiales bacterium]
MTEVGGPVVLPPFAAGSVALGLHLSPGDAASATAGLRAQARAADEATFDGVTLSEHHGGFPGYLPAPTLMAAVLLGAMPLAWAAPCPTVLPLRDAAAVVEELAWLAAAYPGRVGAGFVPGYHARDFEIVGRDFATRGQHFHEALPQVASALAGQPSGALACDPAVAALSGFAVPVVSGAGGPLGARRAARAGAGLLVNSLTPPDEARRLIDAYRAAGGIGPCVLIRRAWIGTLPESVGAQLDRYYRMDSAGSLGPPPASGVVSHGDPGSVAESLAVACSRAGADSLNLRVFAEDLPAEVLVDQIGRFGVDVLPELRQAFRRPPFPVRPV